MHAEAEVAVVVATGVARRSEDELVGADVCGADDLAGDHGDSVECQAAIGWHCVDAHRIEYLTNIGVGKTKVAGGQRQCALFRCRLADVCTAWQAVAADVDGERSGAAVQSRIGDGVLNHDVAADVIGWCEVERAVRVEADGAFAWIE